MIEFKVGDRLECLNGDGWEHFVEGGVYECTRVWPRGGGVDISGRPVGSMHFRDFRLAEDRTNWHPHADVIIAWAKGEKIQYNYKNQGWEDSKGGHTSEPPFCCHGYDWRIKPDNSEEIDRIKQEIQTHGKAIDELQAKLKELES